MNDHVHPPTGHGHPVSIPHIPDQEPEPGVGKGGVRLGLLDFGAGEHSDGMGRVRRENMTAKRLPKGTRPTRNQERLTVKHDLKVGNLAELGKVSGIWLLCAAVETLKSRFEDTPQ